MAPMDFQVESLGPCRKKIVVTIPPERIGEEFDKKYDEINENVALPGFRPGRAPRKLLEKRFGTRLAGEVKDDLVKAALEKLVEEKKAEPLAAPDIDLSDVELEPGQPLTFEFEMVTKPEFETPEYKGLEVKVPPIAVSEEEIDRQIDLLRRRDAKLEIAKDAKAEAGDVLVVDWRALDGDSVEARDDNVYYPLGRGVLAGFVAEEIDAQLDGAEVGAEAQATVHVPVDDPREELRDRELALHVELKQIKRYVLPPIDQAFLEKHDFDDVDELRADMKKQIARAKQRQRDAAAEHQLVEQLLDAVEISLPESFVERELEHWAMRKRMSLQVEKVEDEEIAKQVEAARADTKAAIERDMQRHFLLERVSEEEDVEVTEAELVQAIEEIAMAYGHPVEEVAASFRESGRLAELRAEIRHRKARQILRQHATLVEDAALAEEGKATKKAKKVAKKKAATKKKAKAKTKAKAKKKKAAP